MSKPQPTRGPTIAQFESGFVRLPIDTLWTIEGGAKGLKEVAEGDVWSKGWQGLAVAVTQSRPNKSFVFSNDEFSKYLLRSAEMREQKGKIAASDLVEVFGLEEARALPRLKPSEMPTQPSLVIEKRKAVDVWLGVQELPKSNPPGWWETPVHGGFLRMPIEDPYYIDDGLAGLKQFLGEGKWTASDWDRPILLRRPDTGFYFFTSSEFKSIAARIGREGARVLNDEQLQSLFGIHEYMTWPLVGIADNPTQRSIVMAGAAPGAAWISTTAAQQSQIPIFMPTDKLDLKHGFDLPTRGVRPISPSGPQVPEYRPPYAAPSPPDEGEPSRGHVSFGVDMDAEDQEEVFRATADEATMLADEDRPFSGTIQRTPHMDLSPDPPFTMGTEIEVSVYADELAAHSGEETKPIVLEIGKETYSVGVWLVASAHFMILDEPPLKTMVIKAKETASEKVVFRVQVVRDLSQDGPATISALFNYEGRPCGRVTRKLGSSAPPPDANDSGPPVQQQSPDNPPPGLQIDSTAKRPDLIVDISDPYKTLSKFECLITTHLIDDYKDGVHDEWMLPGATKDIVKEYFDEFTTSGPDGRLDSLRGAGVNLFKCAPEKFKKIFWELVDSGKTFRTISITSQEPCIPWELMIPTRTVDGNEERRNPLGQEFAVGRWLHDDHILPSQRITLRDSRVFSPTYSGTRTLTNAEEEAKYVLSLFAPGEPITPAALQGLKLAMKAGGATVLHFICHATSSTKIAQRILLEDGGILTSTQIDGAAEFSQAFKATKPLVFINACEAGRPAPALVGVGGFAASFINAGASCVIAPLWSVKDSLAHEVATAFYREICANPHRSFAEILSAIRAKTYDETTGGEDTYAAYCFYGDPLAIRNS